MAETQYNGVLNSSILNNSVGLVYNRALNDITDQLFLSTGTTVQSMTSDSDEEDLLDEEEEDVCARRITDGEFEIVLLLLQLLSAIIVYLVLTFTEKREERCSGCCKVGGVLLSVLENKTSRSMIVAAFVLATVEILDTIKELGEAGPMPKILKVLYRSALVGVLNFFYLPLFHCVSENTLLRQCLGLLYAILLTCWSLANTTSVCSISELPTDKLLVQVTEYIVVLAAGTFLVYKFLYRIIRIARRNFVKSLPPSITKDPYQEEPEDVVVRLEEIANFKVSDLTVENLSRFFRLNPKELVLVDDIGVYILPDENGRFYKSNFSEKRTYIVDGDPMKSDNHISLLSETTSKKSTTFYYRVVEYCICNEKGKLQTLQTEPLQLNNDTSNIHDIASLAQETFQLQDVQLLVCTATGDPIEDSEETRGAVFWNNSSMRVIVIPKEFHTKILDSLRSGVVEAENLGIMLEQLNLNLQEIRDGCSSCKSKDQKLVQMQDLLSCKICREISDGDLAVTTCCRQLIGCAECVERWIQLERGCLLCRSQDVRIFKCRGLAISGIIN